jgi:hypothetical protein
MRQANMPEVRDVAVRKLRDVTVAVAIAAAAGVGVIAWVSAATIPGSSAPSGLTGNAATGVDDQPVSVSGDGFTKAPRGSNGFGPGVAVSGGSR